MSSQTFFGAWRDQLTAAPILTIPGLQVPEQDTGSVELSVVMPCLNEAETLGACVSKAQRALREAGIAGEVIVADNGSIDGSQAIAESLGAKVVTVSAR